MSIALSMEISISLFDKAVREVVDGLGAPVRVELDADTTKMLETILDNAEPRLKVLRSYLG